jgi:hypothetical protein
MTQPYARAILLGAIAASIAGIVLFAPLPVVAAPAAPASAGTFAAAIGACPVNLASPQATPAVPPTAVLPEWLDLDANDGLSTVFKHKFHGFCRCGCSNIPDCNTDADCGGSTCSTAISCC